MTPFKGSHTAVVPGRVSFHFLPITHEYVNGTDREGYFRWVAVINVVGEKPVLLTSLIPFALPV